MEKIWFNPEDPAGFGSVSKMAKSSKTSKMEADKWLRQQFAYSLNKPLLKIFPTRRLYRITHSSNQWKLRVGVSI